MWHLLERPFMHELTDKHVNLREASKCRKSVSDVNLDASTMEALSSESLITSDGSTVSVPSALAGKSAIALYFSAHW